MSDLLPCPFCGGKASSYWSGTRRRGWANGFIFVKCTICGAQAQAFPTKAEDVEKVDEDEWGKAAFAWNRRAECTRD